MRIIVRDGGLRDINFIRDLSVRSAEYSIPDTRKISKEEVMEYVKNALSKLELAFLKNNYKVLIAEDEDSGKPVAYLTMQLECKEIMTGEKQIFLHELSVEPEYRGKGIVDMLIDRAAGVAKEKGYKYLVGEISKSNQRSLNCFVKKLGFEIEKYQVVKVIE